MMSISSVSSLPTVTYEKMSQLISYGDVRLSVSLVGINTLFLLGKFFEEFPRIVTDTAYTSLKFIGLVSIDYQVRKAVGNTLYFLHALKNKGPYLVAYTAGYSFYYTSAVYFTLGGVGAALATMFHYSVVAARLFSSMRVIGLASLVVGMILDCADYFMQYRTIDLLGEVLEEENRHERLESLAESCVVDGDDDLATELALSMDSYTRDTLIDRLRRLDKTDSKRREKLDALFREALKNVEMQRQRLNDTTNERIVGYIMRFLVRAYPGGRVEAVVNSSVNLYYTKELVMHRLNELEQQERIRSI